MPSRSPAVQRICSAAVAHFAARGYDAASLQEIAEAVGIRKASLYSHFENKDALFLEVFNDAVDVELLFLEQCFASEARRTAPGAHYCNRLAQRHGESEHLRFLLRTAYLPPAGLWAEVGKGYERYQTQLLASFAEKLATSTWGPGLSVRDLVQFQQAYLGIVDSLHVELVYAAGKNFPVRLKALQRLLTAALQQTAGQAARPNAAGHP